MMISTKGRYALRLLVDIAQHRADDFIPLKEVAERQEISEKYLESIIKVLVRNNFLEGLRGKGGGYRLTKAPEMYTVGSVLRLTEGSLAPVTCLESEATQCPRMSSCPTLPMWKELDSMINNFFDNITIADLMANAPTGDDYVI